MEQFLECDFNISTDLKIEIKIVAFYTLQCKMKARSIPLTRNEVVKRAPGFIVSFEKPPPKVYFLEDTLKKSLNFHAK